MLTVYSKVNCKYCEAIEKVFSIKILITKNYIKR